VEEARYKLEDFELYCLARRFRRGVYRLIRELPPEERFSLAPQMRRAAISVTNNIAEGHGRWHYQENVQFCRVARGSVEELIDDINICLDEEYGSRQHNEDLKIEAYGLIARINGYIVYLKRNRPGAEAK
jgi:four helix bundle protein